MKPVRAARSVTLLLAIGLLTACATARLAEGERGTDISSVRIGATQAEIEATLGLSVREWRTASGIRYRLYSYDAGAPPSKGDAATMLYLDIVSAGLAELIIAADNSHGGNAFKPMHTSGLLAVAYADDDRVVGVFPGITEFSVLPDDGHAPPDAGPKSR